MRAGRFLLALWRSGTPRAGDYLLTMKHMAVEGKSARTAAHT